MFRYLLILALPATFLAAQGTPPAAVSPGGPQMGPLRPQLVARLRRVRMERLQQALGITEEKAGTIADRWAQFDTVSFANRLQMRQLHQQVNSILLSSIPEDEKNVKLRPLVDQFTALRQQQQQAKQKFEEDIRASLTPAQQGRFILVVEEIQHALQEAIRAQGLGGRGGGAE